MLETTCLPRISQVGGHYPTHVRVPGSGVRLSRVSSGACACGLDNLFSLIRGAGDRVVHLLRGCNDLIRNETRRRLDSTRLLCGNSAVQ